MQCRETKLIDHRGVGRVMLMFRECRMLLFDLPRSAPLLKEYRLSVWAALKVGVGAAGHPLAPPFCGRSMSVKVPTLWWHP